MPSANSPVECASHAICKEQNVARFVRQRAGEELFAAWWFYYDNSDHLWACVEGHGDYDSGSAVMSDCVYDSAAEYRCDGGRARYLVRPRDPATLDLTGGSGVSPESLAAWRDYSGESIYRDYGVALDSEGGSPSEQTAITDGRAFLAGVGYLDAPGFPWPLAPEVSLEARYEHSDQIGTVRAISGDEESDPPGPAEIIAASEYTAFGEEVQGSYPHFDVNKYSCYGYAGVHGYEHSTHYAPFASYSWKDPLDDLGWLHVGHRYYDPACGRFMQRDRIGIFGGLNTYAYVANNPVMGIDPSGLSYLFCDLVIDLTGGHDNDSFLDDEESVQAWSEGAFLVSVGCFGGAGGLYLVGFNPIIWGGVGGVGATQGETIVEEAEGLATRGSEWVTEIITRENAGADGGISKQIITRLNGVAVSIQHRVWVSGQVVHDHTKYIGQSGAHRFFPSDWTGHN